MSTWLVVCVIASSLGAYASVASVAFAAADRAPYVSLPNVLAPVIAICWPVAVPIWMLARVVRPIGEWAGEAFLAWCRRPRIPRATARTKGRR